MTIRNTDEQNSILVAGKMAEYDERAKHLLARKEFLSRILKYTLKEFRDTEIPQIMECIDGEVLVSRVPVDPGQTNEKKENGTGSRIRGMDSEDTEIGEGTIRFDVIFYIWLPGTEGKKGKRLGKIIVNIEAQKDLPSEYCLMDRGLYYACRMISSQKERDFADSDYSGILPVYSIWLCMNRPQASLEYTHLQHKVLHGKPVRHGNMDQLNIFIVGIPAAVPESKEGNELFRFLGTLFSRSMEAAEKARIMETEFGMPMYKNVESEVAQMCNLGQGIFEEGLEKGRQEERLKAICHLVQNGQSLDFIRKLGYTEEEYETALTLKS